MAQSQIETKKYLEDNKLFFQLFLPYIKNINKIRNSSIQPIFSITDKRITKIPVII